jgi:hypothetical protein
MMVTGFDSNYHQTLVRGKNCTAGPHEVTHLSFSLLLPSLNSSDEEGWCRINSDLKVKVKLPFFLIQDVTRNTLHVHHEVQSVNAVYVKIR